MIENQSIQPGEEPPAQKKTRRSRRTAINGVFVAIDAPEVASEPWVVDAIDINANGLGLVLPPELLEGTRVLLSFRLDDREFSRLPAKVLHNMRTSGGVRFEVWPDEDRLKLLEYLIKIYEAVD